MAQVASAPGASLELEKSSLETRLEDQYRERDNRDKQIQQIGLQVLRLTFRC